MIKAKTIINVTVKSTDLMVIKVERPKVSWLVSGKFKFDE